LFNNMNEADRPASSVPEMPNCVQTADQAQHGDPGLAGAPHPAGSRAE
jgi:hypothetical protein